MSLVYDASIRMWRPRTQADDDYAQAVVEAVRALEGKL